MSAGRVDVHCAHCGARFDLPAQQAGSLQNCPTCGRATEVPGENDPLWAIVRGAVVVGVVTVGVVVGQATGPLEGIGAAAVLAAIVAVIRSGL